VAEFGWVVGLPDSTVTEQYFHVKYAPEGRGDAAGGDTVSEKQAIFHRPASSGEYALVCNLELYRIGLNDITREYVISPEDREKRARALVASLAASLVKISGAQRNTQNPHLVAASGILAASSSALPAPTISPLADNYRDQTEEIAQKLGQFDGKPVATHRFGSISEGVGLLMDLAQRLELA
jgi:CRISPR-associated protein Cst2